MPEGKESRLNARRTGSRIAGMRICVVAVLAGCASVVTIEPPLRSRVLDGFEQASGWRVDVQSGGDPARLAISSASSRSGLRALKVVCRARSGVVRLARAVTMDLSRAAALRISARSPEGMRIALGLTVEPGWYFETRAASVPGGEWRDSVFRLDRRSLRSVLTGWKPRAVLANSSRVTKLWIVAYPAAGDSTFYLDDLGLLEGSRALSRPRDVSAEVLAESPRAGETVELKASAGSGEVESAWAEFDSPSGRKMRVAGFRKGGEWRFRYLPQEPGTHEVHVVMECPSGGEAVELGFEAAAGEARLVRARREGLFLPGDVRFFPVGMNVAWAEDLERFFKKLNAVGANCARVWLGPQSLPVERAPGACDEKALDRLDRIFDHARANGLRVIVNLLPGSLLAERWMSWHYAVGRGGMCSSSGEFFASTEAKRAFKKTLRSVAGRLAARPELLAWELVSDVDETHYFERSDVVEWLDEMSSFLRSVDPFGHPVAVSVRDPASLEWVRAARGVDLFGGIEAGVDIERWAKAAEPLERPFQLFECRCGWKDPSDASDGEGRRLRASMWLSALSGSCGAALPWFWDAHIEGKKLYPQFEGLARLAAGSDFYPRRVEGSFGKSGRVWGLASREGALFYIFDPKVLSEPDSKPSALSKGGKLELEGLLEGEYEIEVFNPRDGKRVHVVKRRASNGVLKVGVPGGVEDLVVRIKAVRKRPVGIR